MCVTSRVDKMGPSFFLGVLEAACAATAEVLYPQCIPSFSINCPVVSLPASCSALVIVVRCLSRHRVGSESPAVGD